MAADIDEFVQTLKTRLDGPRVAKALKMLKKDGFRLFHDIQEDSVEGVVKSQGDPTLVYACRIDADGTIMCCTQNMNACGGLRGKACKHILVLLIGLSRAGELNVTHADKWVEASLANRPKLDKDRMGDVFLRYQGAEAGDIDWRPTETVPEDFYAY